MPLDGWNISVIGNLLAIILLVVVILLGSQWLPKPPKKADKSSVSKESKERPKVYRIRGLPTTWDKQDVDGYIHGQFPLSSPRVRSFVVEVGGRSCTATALITQECAPEILLAPANTELHAGYASFDHRFHGLTTLYRPPSKDHKVDIVVIQGLGGHAFGSFKQRSGDYMWLLDALPYDLKDAQTGRPMARIMIYGHESTVADSNSFQGLDDIALAFRDALLPLTSTFVIRPIILMGHSLGGLIAKQALVSMAASSIHSDTPFERLYRAIHGIIFFGVPHAGMHIDGLRKMALNNANVVLIESLGDKSSAILGNLRQQFDELIHSPRQLDIFCFYETETSPTPALVEKHWKMTGPKVVFVSKSSAISCGTSELSDDRICAINRSHSDIVKFSRADEHYDNVRNRLQLIAERASEKFIAVLEELHSQVLAGNEAFVNELLEAGADIEKRNGQNHTPLLAAAFGRNMSMMRLLLDAGADINASDGLFGTPVHEAVKIRNLEMIRILIDRSADLSSYDAWGHSPFHFAAISSTEILQHVISLLPRAVLFDQLERRTRKDASSGGGETPLLMTSLRGQERPMDMEAFEEGARNARLLLEHGANVNACSSKEGQTALHKAAKTRNEPLARVLLAYGIRRDILNNDGIKAADEKGVGERMRVLIDSWSSL